MKNETKMKKTKKKDKNSIIKPREENDTIKN
jgi:predicted GIY-YIG superfamily endonuclease